MGTASKANRVACFSLWEPPTSLVSLWSLVSLCLPLLGGSLSRVSGGGTTKTGRLAPTRFACGRGEAHPEMPPMMEIIGMNSATTMVPTTTARKMIKSGSMIEVIAPTALSTSSS